MLHCNGKCQLAKKLKQEEKKDRQNPERKLENKNEVVLFFDASSSENYQLIARHLYYIYAEKPAIARVIPVFHPPGV